MNIVELARKFHYLREVGENKGLRVESIQHWSGGQSGDSWCMEFIWFLFDVFYEGACPFERVQAVEEFHQTAINNGWVIDAPEAECLVISVTPEGHGHHIAICTVADPLTTFAGNTSADGLSSNGDRAAEHEVSATSKVFVRVPAFAGASS